MSDPASTAAPAYAALRAHLREAATLGSATSLLAWDQETMMPPAGAELRASQLSLLSGLVHERRTAPAVAEWLGECEADAALLEDQAVAANLREIRRGYELATRLPTTLVREMAETSSHALEAWKDARERDDFAAFAPWLERTLDLTRQKAECYGVPAGGTAYDPLLQEYEPDMTTAEVSTIFAALRPPLVALIRDVADSGVRAPDRLLRVRIPIPTQEEINRTIATRIGFDLGAGRLDVSTHPFCEGLGPGDTRLTTRYRDDGFAEALASTLHEAGHGLYEQGLPKAEHFGEPLGDAVSLGIHESQSRLWENMVGRSLPFWRWALGEIRGWTGEIPPDLEAEEAYASMNAVAPGPIRVEADEATYNLHIMLRFDLEQALLSGDLAVHDLPGVWRERMRDDLGVEVTTDREGALQDIHWAMGGIGYFPTYTLGNLYAAQLWAAAHVQVPHLAAGIGRGDFGPLLGWLRTEIHGHGRRYSAAELCRRVTGVPLSHVPLLAYLEGKLRPLYAL